MHHDKHFCLGVLPTLNYKANTKGGIKMMNNSGAFRKKKTYFSQVSNFALRDEKLSLKAKGLYSLIQSYITIEGFTLYKNTLKKDCSEGSTAFENAWNELKKVGYLKQFRSKTPEGYFTYEYDLIDIVHTPETRGVDNLLCGEGGLYNKTNNTNTNVKNTKILHHLGELNDDYISGYIKIANTYGYKPKRVTTDNLFYIQASVNTISQDIDIDEWEEAVTEHFNNLPKSNDGDIMSFLKASFRYFEIDLEQME